MKKRRTPGVALLPEGFRVNPKAAHKAAAAARARAMHLRTRALAVLRFFEAGGSICPHARAAARAPAGVVVAQLAHLDEDEVLLGLMSAFTPATAAAIVVAPTDPRSHAAAQLLAEQLFGRVALACHHLHHPLASIDRADVLQQMRQALAHPLLHTELVLFGAPMFTLAMGPAYRPAHPRYAPHLCLVLTWQRDVVQSIQTHPGVATRIREAMRERTGSVYDAVTLYLEER